MYGKPVTNNMGGYKKKMFNRRHDRKRFSSTAGMTNSLNLRANPQRGGIRL